jgi:hypothetical protein
MRAAPVSYVIWTDVAPERAPEFNEWYNREHAPDRVLRIPGFVQARRFEAVDGAPGYAAWFDVAGPEVFRNDAYMEMRRTPDPRSQQFIPLFRNVIRFIGQAAADATAVPGVIEGTWVRFAAFKAQLTEDDDRAWTEVTAALVRKPGIMRARLFRAVPELLDGAVRNMTGHVRESLRGPDRLGDALVMIEGVTDAQVAAIETDLQKALAAHPGWTPLGSARMRQLMRVAKPA